MVWVIYENIYTRRSDTNPYLIKYFDTKKEAEDYLIEDELPQGYQIIIWYVYRCIFGFDLTRNVNGNISYEQLELLEEEHPKVVRIDNFLIRLTNVKNIWNFVEIFKDDFLQIIMNDTDYYSSALAGALRRGYFLYEKPGKLFF